MHGVRARRACTRGKALLARACARPAGAQVMRQGSTCRSGSQGPGKDLAGGEQQMQVAGAGQSPARLGPFPPTPSIPPFSPAPDWPTHPPSTQNLLHARRPLARA